MFADGVKAPIIVATATATATPASDTWDRALQVLAVTIATVLAELLISWIRRRAAK